MRKKDKILMIIFEFMEEWSEVKQNNKIGFTQTESN